jgi:hypothetical protein
MIAGMVDSVASDVAQGRKRTRASVARLLSLAATPTFAIMALFTAVHRASMPDMICTAIPDESPLTGMMPMYLLMSAFHLAPWLGLLPSRWPGAPRS